MPGRFSAPSHFLLARWVLLAALAGAPVAAAVTLTEAQEHFRKGEYEAVLAPSGSMKTSDEAEQESWLRLEIQTLLDLGRYEEANDQLTGAAASVLFSLPLRLLQREVRLRINQTEGTTLTMPEITRAVNYAASLRGREHVRSAEYQALLGEACLIAGLDPRLALENFLRPAQRAEPASAAAFLVAGKLALEKRDFALAARTFGDGLKIAPEEPDLLWGLAASFQTGDRKQLVAAAERALQINPRHVPTHVLLAENFIDAEQRELASVHLDLALAVNPHAPEAHALRAVLAHLARDPAAAARHRTAALSTWRNNPRVDHLIGRKLSQQYQFSDGAAAQRRALGFDPAFTPAKVQLAQDLLRLGQEGEGWKLAAEAHQADAYNVEAFNLSTLHDQLDHFTVLSSPHFRVRMAANEAPLYGDRVLALLERAHGHLTQRYGIALEQPAIVEIYPDPKDFAVRTFGMPDIGGFLGVCFGPLFTINSPASAQANWEAVLWHEFTHVITLTMTRNRMPRWLSEGISVFEERQANPAWGQLMSLNYRERIMTGKTQPISRMSSAFLEAKDGRDTQFAYFQSALVVQFLVERHGFEKLRSLLKSLADGTEANAALAQTFGPLTALDDAFAAYARDAAVAFGKNLDFRRETGGITQMLAQNLPGLRTSPNVPLLLNEAREAAERSEWKVVQEKLAPLSAAGLYFPGTENFHTLLAQAAAGLGDVAAEREALLTIAAHEGDALSAVTRLLSLAQAANDAPATKRWAEALLAINPLAPTPWRALLGAAEQTDDHATAAHAGVVLLKLDPPDFASLHFRVARQLASIDSAAARRHALQALEEAPRFRAAYDLLAMLPADPGSLNPPQ